LKPRPTGAARAKPPSSTSRPSGMRLSKTVDPAIQEHVRNSLTPSATYSPRRRTPWPVVASPRYRRSAFPRMKKS